MIAVCAIVLIPLTDARAEGPDGVETCGSLRDVITMPDGGYVAAGTVFRCDSARISPPGSGGPAARIALVRVNGDGSRNPAFGDGGIRLLAQGDSPVRMELLPAGDGFLLVSNNTITRFQGDGSTDFGFGDDGSIVPAGEFEWYRLDAVTTQPDGKVVVASRSEPPAGEFAVPVVRRYSAEGQVDPSFGGGEVSPVIPETYRSMSEDRIAVQPDGKILVAGWNRENRFGLFRLAANGDLDTTFGANGNGFASATAVVASLIDAEVLSIGLRVPGRIQLSFSVTRDAVKTYPQETGSLTLDQDGTQIGTAAQFPVKKFLDFVQLPGGNVAGAGYLDNVIPYDEGPVAPNEMRFGIFDQGGSTALPDGSDAIDVKSSPSGGSLGSLIYDPARDALVGAGTIADTSCFELCGYFGRSFALVRIDARTGALDPTFGTGGIVMDPRNTCPGQETTEPDAGSPSPWRRCPLTAPKLRPSGRLTGNPQHPGFRLRVRLSKPVNAPAGIGRRVKVRLPDWLRLRPGKFMVKAVVHGAETEGKRRKVKARRSGRVISIEYEPRTGQSYDYEPDTSERIPNSAVTFEIRTVRGSLRPVRATRRPAKLRFRVTGTNVGGRWYADGSSSARLTVKSPWRRR